MKAQDINKSTICLVKNAFNLEKYVKKQHNYTCKCFTIPFESLVNHKKTHSERVEYTLSYHTWQILLTVDNVNNCSDIFLVDEQYKNKSTSR